MKILSLLLTSLLLTLSLNLQAQGTLLDCDKKADQTFCQSKKAYVVTHGSPLLEGYKLELSLGTFTEYDSSGEVVRTVSQDNALEGREGMNGLITEHNGFNRISQRLRVAMPQPASNYHDHAIIDGTISFGHKVTTTVHQDLVACAGCTRGAGECKNARNVCKAAAANSCPNRFTGCYAERFETTTKDKIELGLALQGYWPVAGANYLDYRMTIKVVPEDVPKLKKEKGAEKVKGQDKVKKKKKLKVTSAQLDAVESMLVLQTHGIPYCAERDGQVACSSVNSAFENTVRRIDDKTIEIKIEIPRVYNIVYFEFGDATLGY